MKYIVDNFLASLNRLSLSFKFTIEKESNNSIPFLDVEVIRGENNRLQFKIYRKPTHSNLYIHAFSGHSDKIKEAAIKGVISAKMVIIIKFLFFAQKVSSGMGALRPKFLGG